MRKTTWERQTLFPIRTSKKISDVPFPSRDVTNKTLPGGKITDLFFKSASAEFTPNSYNNNITVFLI